MSKVSFPQLTLEILEGFLKDRLEDDCLFDLALLMGWGNRLYKRKFAEKTLFPHPILTYYQYMAPGHEYAFVLDRGWNTNIYRTAIYSYDSEDCEYYPGTIHDEITSFCKDLEYISTTEYRNFLTKQEIMKAITDVRQRDSSGTDTTSQATSDATGVTWQVN